MYTSNGYVLDESPSRLGQLEPVPAEERDDREALWRRLRRDGYLFLTGFLDPQMIAEFRRFYFAELRDTGVVDPDADPGLGLAGGAEIDRAALRRALYDRIIPSPEYEALVQGPRVREWFRWFLGEDVALHKRRILRHTQPGEGGIGTATQAHYDLVYLREGTDRVLSMWIPLGDCPIERGGLTYLERSHHRVLEEERNGTLPTPVASITADLPGLADRHDERWLITDYAAGDVVVHSAHIVHAALDNVAVDGVMRLSTDIRYQRVSEPIDWRWEHDESQEVLLNGFQFLTDPVERARVKTALEAVLAQREGNTSEDPSGDFDIFLSLIEDETERERVAAAIDAEYRRPSKG
ncbi:phytanoyl-CoA dioxygenase family protein [Microbacterium sp. RD1]|uniref:phytanoyl-CoA dioxygenase family protein n=1 Tax=Microbacterium sp. RD1 TaxID=3457313 RepID=UPI003FA5F276